MSANSTPTVDVRQIADLAKLNLAESEIAQFQEEIAAILTYVDQLAALDLDDVEPTAHAAPIVNVYRDDTPQPTMERAAAMANAPATIDEELIRVPVVINPDDQGGA